MPYAPLYGPWSADANGDASTPGAVQGAPYPPDWMMPASATAAAAASAGPQFAAPPQPASPTGATTPPSAAAPNDASAPPIAPANPPVTSNGLPWWVMAVLEPGGSPLARGPLVTPDWFAHRSLLGLIAQRPGLFPLPPGSHAPPPSASQPVPFNITRPQLSMLPSADAQPPSPPRSVLFNGAPPQSGALPPDLASDSDDSDRSAADLTVPNLPLSKSDTPFFPPPLRQPSITLPSWLDAANFLAPNVVEYFTKPDPPPAPFPATPGKIPSLANPYAAPAAGDVINTLAMVLSGGEGFALDAARLAAKTPALAEREVAAAEKLAAARRAQLAINSAAGKAFEAKTQVKLDAAGIESGAQITAQVPSGRVVRLDFVTREPDTGEVGCIDCKASPTAPVRTNQKLGYEELGREGATILGKGKPGFPGGMKIPATRVEIRRPED